MLDEPRRKTRYRGERCTSKLTLNNTGQALDLFAPLGVAFTHRFFQKIHEASLLKGGVVGKHFAPCCLLD